ncbi:uncharacterized protein (TIGR01440 family) [Desulfitispora alkaliphila]|uniref:TIGR01440 family protein n=1 Tax=Desulfitispora alkaliphila TaxID=622674 RepID=UPI003D1E31C9
MDLNSITSQVRQAVEGLVQEAKLQQGQILVVGGSTSEVAGERIGTKGSSQIAEAILEPVLEVTKREGLFLAIQCCEHLNRALVVEQQAVDKYNLEPVTVVPVPQAGGALASKAFDIFTNPVAVESISAHGGMDIGDTFIGMHLKAVAVPVRLDIKQIGNAHLTLARTRPKLIGGQRAVYIIEGR